jgi:hypothetical protein
MILPEGSSLEVPEPEGFYSPPDMRSGKGQLHTVAVPATFRRGGGTHEAKPGSCPEGRRPGRYRRRSRCPLSHHVPGLSLEVKRWRVETGRESCPDPWAYPSMSQGVASNPRNPSLAR